MSEQFEQLKLLYQQILTAVHNTKKAIDKSEYDEAVSNENYKTQLVSKLVLVEKTVILTDDETQVINGLKQQILDFESENLNIALNLREKAMQELKIINSQNKIANKYNQTETVEGTICDYTSD